MKHAFLIAVLAVVPALRAENSELLAKPWTARWISVPGAPRFDYGVYHFRRTFDLASKPDSFVVHVTADNRYVLFVNGERASVGPARGDLHHWRYETVDMAKFLKPGRNVLAAVVWNFGPLAGEAQITHQTGFLLQGDDKAERIADTGPQWKCVRDEAYQPAAVTREEIGSFYYAAGPADRVDGARYPWGWEQPGFDDSAWKPALPGAQGAPRESIDSPSRWMLVPRGIPQMEFTAERLAAVRRAEGVTPSPAFPREAAPCRIPANTKAKILLDQQRLTTAYPEVVVSGGKGASVTLRYAEALFLPNKRDKGNRNEIEGKIFLGYGDTFLTDGGRRRLFRPLWWRTWRYLEMTVETKAEPLTVDDLRGIYTGYPFERRARFESDAPELQKMLDTGWRTARLCAHETYMDCPYYEQLQYVGDTRIQALVSLYMTGDGRLMRNAIEQIDSSRTAEGATYSRAPSRLQQYIPPFSLWWIGMVHDYWMYQDDPKFVASMLPGVRSVLAFYAARQRSNFLVGAMPWWNFIDWAAQFPRGVPTEQPGGASAELNLQLALAYGWAADLEESFGSHALASEYRKQKTGMGAAIRSAFWDPARKLYSEADPTKFSQHTNALAVLAGLTEGADARALVDRITEDKSLVQSSIYFRYYLHRALAKAGQADRYLDMLGEWRAMLDRGLTTWAEHADPVRSDCHAWGASPNIELFRTVLGIDSAAPGFRRVLVRPALGKLRRASGTMPHPRGEISVSLEAADGGKLNAEVKLPAGVEGEFEWRGERRRLAPGATSLAF